MSLLPPPFQTSDGATQRYHNQSFLRSSEPVKAAHFPPWYSGSESYSSLHHDLSQNRAVQLGAPPAWTCTEPRDSVSWEEWSDGPVQPHPHRNSYSYKKHNFKSSAKDLHYCDACNRGFGNREELAEHQAKHVKCPFENCNFTAHPKVVILHQKLQHASGLAEKLVCLDTPEDIRKWREERKRNFPTAANVERKKKEEAEKLARGEELQNKFFGKMRQGRGNFRKGNVQSQEQFSEHRNGRNGRKRRRHHKRNNNSSAVNSPKDSSCPQTSATPKRLTSSVNPLLQTKQDDVPWMEDAQVSSAKGISSEGHGSDLEEGQEKERCPSPLAVCNMGGSISLLADYGSGSDSNQEEEKSGRPRKCRYLPAKPVPDLYPTNRRWHRGRTHGLLEKLLANEIRHERNVILQCLHYTVRKNFFQESI